MSLATRIFHSLEGRWTLSRFISGHGKMEGTATFKKNSSDNTCLHYREEGVFIGDNGKANNVFREYYYRLSNDTISVLFSKKPEKLFHILSFADTSPITATASHLCECDNYDAIYTFATPDEFTLFYSVKGPKKDYSIQTVFKRCLKE
ncbi:MAG: hypothetical protein JSS60_02740 [Verrucomicrobia bacterium]|nr:hypothetical protein [Verrucomicrobiota bacterium]